MSITTTYEPNIYQGDNLATVFPTNWQFDEDADVIVVQIDSTGTETLLVRNIDYSITGAGGEAGGDVTLFAALPTGEELIVSRETSLIPSTKFTPNSGFSGLTVGDSISRLILAAQEADYESDRSIKSQIGEEGFLFPSATERANKWLLFDSNGNLTVGVAAPNISTLSSVGEALITAGTAKAQRQLLALDEPRNLANSLQATVVTTGTGAAYVVTTAWNFAESDIDTFWNLFKIRFHADCEDFPTITIDGNGPYDIAMSSHPDGLVERVFKNQIRKDTSVLGFVDSISDRFQIQAGVNVNAREDTLLIRKLVDEIKTSDIALGIDNEFNIVDVVQPGVYKFEAWLIYTAGVGGFKYRIGPTSVNNTVEVYDPVTGVVGDSGTDYNFPGAATKRRIKIEGILRRTLSDGSVYITWAQDTSSAEPTTIHEGSWMKMELLRGRNV